MHEVLPDEKLADLLAVGIGVDTCERTSSLDTDDTDDARSSSSLCSFDGKRFTSYVEPSRKHPRTPKQTTCLHSLRNRVQLAPPLP